MEELEEYRLKLIDFLERQPAEYRAAIHAIPERHWHTPDVGSEGESIHLLVAHVRDYETQVFLPRLRRMLAEDAPTLEPFASHKWSAEHYQPGEGMNILLHELTHARAEAVHLLRHLQPEDWSRTGFHPPSGQRSVMWWAERAHNHARDHLREIEAVLDSIGTRPFKPVAPQS
jgi:hypothetical protein